MTLIGFDFSINKPACCILKNNQFKVVSPIHGKSVLHVTTPRARSVKECGSPMERGVGILMTCRDMNILMNKTSLKQLGFSGKSSRMIFEKWSRLVSSQQNKSDEKEDGELVEDEEEELDAQPVIEHDESHAAGGCCAF